MESEALTGDHAFDRRVVIAHGASELMPYLSADLREVLGQVVGGFGVTAAQGAAALEPARAADVTTLEQAVEVLRGQIQVALRLAEPAPLRELLGRWWRAEGAPAVERALVHHVDARLGDLGTEDAALACDALVEHGFEPPTDRFAAMPLHPVVLAAWLEHGQTFDPRLGQAVANAARHGDVSPAATYLAWLLERCDDDERARQQIDQVWNVAEVVGHPDLADALVLALPPRPPSAARLLLQEVWPRDGAVAHRQAAQLASFRHPEADAALLRWLDRSRVMAEIASSVLARRVVEELEAGRPRQVAAIGNAARTSAVLVDALVRRVPDTHADWLARLRPRSETPALALIRRLGSSPTNVDQALLYWLDGGTQAVQLAAISSLATAGSGRVVPALRERGTGWFGNNVIRAHCRNAAQAVLSRVGGIGALSLTTGEGGDLALAADED